MSAASDPTRIGELLERLVGDAEFRRAFRRDPARACRAHELEALAARFAAQSGDVEALETRESRSGLGGVLVAAVTEGAGMAQPHHPVALHTGHSPIVTATAEHALGPGAGYPGDAAPQARIAAWMADRAERHGLPRELPVMAALVESGLRNLPDGDRASVGYFQMQTVYWLEGYPGYPDKPELQLKWFIDQALAVREQHPELAHDPDRWGEWVADIERPAASLRWKYGARLGDARALLHAADAVHAPPALRTGAHLGVPAGGSGHDVRSLTALRRDAPASRTGFHAAAGIAPAVRGDGSVDALKAEAQRIDQAVVPYSWGGGHGAKQAYGSAVTPLDCSGAVSRVLGVNPRVASDFESWGAAGPGRRVTIFAKDDHVLMEIDGHFWGTSAANPGGGAGWIPRRYLSEAYLSQFTMRHPLEG